MFTYQTTIKLHEADAAGWLFFGNVFKIAHDAYETFMDSAGLSLADMINDGSLILPVVHAEADYKKSRLMGDRLSVKLTCEKIGRSSFTLIYTICGSDGETAYIVKTAHAALDGNAKKVISLPENVKTALQTIC